MEPSQGRHKKFLLNTGSNNEHYDADISGAFVVIDSDLAKLILTRAKALKKLKGEDEQTFKIHFWDGNCRYFGHGTLPEGVQEDLDGAGGWIEAPPDFDLPYEKSANMECEQMVVSLEGIYFWAIPKHDSVIITTDEIPFNEIEALI